MFNFNDNDNDDELKTNIDALIGKTGIVTKKINTINKKPRKHFVAFYL